MMGGGVLRSNDTPGRCRYPHPRKLLIRCYRNKQPRSNKRKFGKCRYKKAALLARCTALEVGN